MYGILCLLFNRSFNWSAARIIVIGISITDAITGQMWRKILYLLLLLLQLILYCVTTSEQMLTVNPMQVIIQSFLTLKMLMFLIMFSIFVYWYMFDCSSVLTYLVCCCFIHGIIVYDGINCVSWSFTVNCANVEQSFIYVAPSSCWAIWNQGGEGGKTRTRTQRGVLYPAKQNRWDGQMMQEHNISHH